MPIHFPMMKGHCQTAMPESSPSMATDCNATVHHKRDCVAWDTSNTYDLVLYQKQIYQPLVWIYLFLWLLQVFVVALGIFSFGTWDLVPWSETEPGPLHWECKVLTTGSSGKSRASDLVTVINTRCCKKKKKALQNLSYLPDKSFPQLSQLFEQLTWVALVQIVKRELHWRFYNPAVHMGSRKRSQGCDMHQRPGLGVLCITATSILVLIWSHPCPRGGWERKFSVCLWRKGDALGNT